MPATYAWVIDKDHLAEPDEPPGTLAGNAATVTGPANAPDDLLAKLRRGEGRQFRLHDGDGILYYEGRILSTDEDGSEWDFGPLDDFGTPNAGCTEIRYWGDDGWETL